MPERPNQYNGIFGAPPGMNMAYEGARGDQGRHNRDEAGLNAAADGSKSSIKELTDVFKPLKQVEYLKAQTEFSKNFGSQLTRTLDSLKKEETKNGKPLVKSAT